MAEAECVKNYSGLTKHNTVFANFFYARYKWAPWSSVVTGQHTERVPVSTNTAARWKSLMIIRKKARKREKE